MLGVRLRNVRSYRDQVIAFPPRGTTVIYGDVGTGKTTILTSISYALFGQQSRSRDPISGYAYPRPRDLLRRGQNSGSVRLLLLHGNKLVVIERGIARRGETYSDTGGYMLVYEHEGERLVRKHYRHYSAQELRSAVLEVLEFKELARDGLKPLVFASAMYVPQFNIVEVMELSEEDRRKLVDVALGIERYYNVLNNIDKIAGGRTTVLGSRLRELEVREEEKLRKLRAEDESALRKSLAERESERELVRAQIESLESSLKVVREELSALDARRRELIRRQSELEAEVRELNRLKSERSERRERLERLLRELGVPSISDIERVRRELEEAVGRASAELSSAAARVREVEAERRSLGELLRDLELKRGELEAERGRLSGSLEELRKRLSSLESELSEVEGLVSRGVCPVCRQPIPHEHGRRLVEEYAREIDSARKEVSEVEGRLSVVRARIEAVISEARNLEDRVRSLDEELSALARRVDELNRSLRLASERSLRVDQVVEIRRELAKLEEEIERREGLERELGALSAELNEVNDRASKCRDRESSILNQLRDLNRRLGEVESSIEYLRNRVRELERVRGELEEVRREREIYGRMNEFLGNVLVEVVKQVESRVRSAVYSKFREAFSSYFDKLMEDHEMLIVDLDHNFTPKIAAYVDGSPQEIAQPSGGQLISVSLAYRLALNALVRALNPSLRGSALILDEPTEGFSPERVDKLRKLLREIGRTAKQIIVVTHDRNLMEIGDCRVRLSIDTSRMLTSVEYEECSSDGVPFEKYRDLVNWLLSDRALRLEASADLGALGVSGFKPFFERRA